VACKNANLVHRNRIVIFGKKIVLLIEIYVNFFFLTISQQPKNGLFQILMLFFCHPLSLGFKGLGFTWLLGFLAGW
jgi:hypothetical protein